MLKKLSIIIMGVMLNTHAWAWQPTKPIEIIVPFTAGSANDILIRTLSAEVQKNTGAQFIINNRAGAGGVIGNAHLAKQPADGHNMLAASMLGIYAMDVLANPTSKLPYHANDFSYVIEMARSPFAILANTNDPVNSAVEFVNVLKTQQNVTVAASGGAQLVLEKLKDRLNTAERVSRIAHKGPIEAVTDVASGNVRFAIVPISVALPFIQGAKVKLVALSGPDRDAKLNADTLNSVLNDMVVLAEWGLLGPKGLPDDVTEWYRREFVRALTSPSVKEIYAKNFFKVNQKHLDPQTFRSHVITQTRNYEPLMQKLLSDLGKK